MTKCLWTINNGWQDVTRYPEPTTAAYVIDPPSSLKPLLFERESVRVTNGPHAGEEGYIQYLLIADHDCNYVVRLKDEIISFSAEELEPVDAPKEVFNAIPC